MNAILRAGVAAGGFEREVDAFPNELSALQALVARARAGDVVTCMTHVERNEIAAWLAEAGFRPMSAAALRDRLHDRARKSR
jgi:cyanophycin synthetase